MLTPKSVPKPGAAVVTAALDLLVAFGADKSFAKPLLAEMKSVQEDNERTLREAQDAISRAEIKAANADQKAQEALDVCRSAHEKLEKKQRADADSFDRLNRTLDARAAELDEREAAISDMEDSYNTRFADLTNREKQVETTSRQTEQMFIDAQASLDNARSMEQAWNKKMAVLRAVETE